MFLDIATNTLFVREKFNVENLRDRYSNNLTERVSLHDDSRYRDCVISYVLIITLFAQASRDVSQCFFDRDTREIRLHKNRGNYLLVNLARHRSEISGARAFISRLSGEQRNATA